MKRHNIYKIILLAVALALVGVYLYIVTKSDNYDYALQLPFVHQQGNARKSCDNLSGFINSTIQKANYCTNDDDCVVSDVGTIPCNCWSLVNKNFDDDPVRQALADYQTQQCAKGVLCESCSSRPLQAEIVCHQSNVCATKQIYTDPMVYVVTNKRNYALGEIVTAVIKNNLDHEVTIPTSCANIPFTLLANDGSKWVKHAAHPLKICDSSPLVLSPKERREYTLDLRQVYEHAAFSISTGTYKLLVYYTRDPNLLGGLGYTEALSDEFTVTADEERDTRSPDFCTEQEKEIQQMIEEENYCAADADCSIREDFACPFGCSHLMNKNADVSKIFQSIRQYTDQCPLCDNSCFEPPKSYEVVCRKGKCFDVRFGKQAATSAMPPGCGDLGSQYVPQQTTEDSYALELKLLLGGQYCYNLPLFDAVWRERGDTILTADYFQNTATKFDVPRKTYENGDYAIVYYPDRKDLGPAFLYREAGAWILDRTAVEAYIHYDTASDGWFAYDGDYPYLSLLRDVFDLQKVTLADGREAYGIK